MRVFSGILRRKRWRVRAAGLVTIVLLFPGLMTLAGAGVATADDPDSTTLRERAVAMASAQPKNATVPKSTGVTSPKKPGSPADMAPTSAAAEGCDISFDKVIAEIPEGNGAVSVVVNFYATLACSFFSAYEYGAVSYLVDRDPLTNGVPLGFGTEIYGTGSQTSIGVAGISSAYPGGQQVETVLYVELYVPGVPLECNNLPRPGVRVIDCAGEGTDYLYALLGSGSYDSKKRGGTAPQLPPCTVESQQWGLPGDVPVPGDYAGDARDDFAIYRPSTAEWWVLGANTVSWGLAGDIPVPEDYTGDGKDDRTIYRPSTAEWWVYGGDTISWGLAGDIPVPEDYVGDARAERAIYRPSTAEWWVLGGDTVSWGLAGDIPVPADFTGDGKAERAIWRPSTGEWWILGVNNVVSWGLPGDIPVPADYTGDGVADRAVYRPSTGEWYIFGRPTPIRLGLANDIPVPADFDNNGRTDVAVWRPSNGTWYYIRLDCQ